MRKRKRKHRVSWQDAVSVCAWCGKPIPEDSEVFSLGAKARPGVNLEGEGNVLELALDARRKALAIIPTQDSQAKKAGWDLLFTLCSEECARALRETVQRQIDIIDNIAVVA
jgi:predicted nucleic acid-binding Zn ribbon protein